MNHFLSRTLGLAVFWASLGVGVSLELNAAVVINEIVASSSSYHLSRNESGGSSRFGFGPSWYENDFASEGWGAGTGPFGFGYGDLGTDVGETMRESTPSLYLRREFDWTPGTVDETASLRLRVEYDDGFVAYLNGVEVARRNLGPEGMFIFARQPSFNKATTNTEEIISLPVGVEDLLPGTNVLAIQVHNTWPQYELVFRPLAFDPTLRLSAHLEIDATNAMPLVNPTDSWRYFVGHTEPSGGLRDPSIASSDPEGAGFHDWIELHNDGAEPVSLLGWRLSDNLGKNDKWFFPDVTLAPDVYYVVYCSGLDRRDPSSGGVHTNFRLKESGEYLALFDETGQIVSEWKQAFPPIPRNYSLGREASSGAIVYFSQPTPGSPNAGPTLVAVVDRVAFSLEPGFYDGDRELILTCPTPNTSIRYTLNGAEPTESIGLDYTNPLSLTESATVRARAYRSDWIPSPTATATYLLNQPAELRSLPALHVSADPEYSLFAPQGILTIQGGSYENDSVWVPSTPMDYNMAIMYGSSFEKPAAVEWIPGTSSLDGYSRIDCGIRFSGSRWSRLRMRLTDLETGTWNRGWPDKPSLSLFFREEYGQESWGLPWLAEARGSEFESLRLRAGKNDWLNPFIRDEVVRRLHGAMGHVVSHGTLVNLFVNGEFKSYYNLVERLREPFFREWHDSDADWDVITVDEVADGDGVRWTQDIEFVQSHSLSNPTNYAEVARRFDLTNFVDYLVLNIYCAMWDWPQNNFYVARERTDDAPWRFYVWDAEGSFDNKPVDYDTIGEDLVRSGPPFSWPYQVIPILYRALVQNPEFRLLFADRAQRHLFHDGALTANHVMATFAALKNELDPTLILTSGQPVQDSFMTNWVANRLPIMLEDMAQANLWPSVNAPEFSLSSGSVEFGDVIEISNPNDGGAIYYTLDGGDPRGTNGQPVGLLPVGPLRLDGSTMVKARVLRNGEWSPLMEAVYEVPIPVGLVISEISYDPTDFNGVSGQSFEFVEIQNTSSNRQALAGVAFTAGVTFSFSSSDFLEPGAHAVVVADAAAFQTRYPSVPVTGTWTDGKLDNQGERLTLSYGVTNRLFSVRYDNDVPWPIAAAGNGSTLVPSHSGVTDPDDYRYWRASSASGGSPGMGDGALPVPPVVIQEVLPRLDARGAWRVELYNPGPASVDLKGWYLSDDAENPFKFQFPDSILIPSLGYLILGDLDFVNVPPPNQVTLRADGGEFLLFSGVLNGGLTGYSYDVSYDALSLGVSAGPHFDSQGDRHVSALNTVTLGAPNAPPLVGPVVINELLYLPADGHLEFVELVNISESPVSMFDAVQPNLTWRLQGLDFSFPSDVTLVPGEMVLVTSSDPTFFRTRYDVPDHVRVFGPWSGNLQDNGERLSLMKPEMMSGGVVLQVPVDVVQYRDDPPWPTMPAGRGASLQRLVSGAFGDDPGNWTAGYPTPGTRNFHAAEVTMSSPSYGDWFALGATVNLTAEAGQFTESLTRVEFYANATLIGQEQTDPYESGWIPTLSGVWDLQAVAVGDAGISVTSSVVRVRVLAVEEQLVSVVMSNAVWKYMDQGLDLGELWRVSEFDDSTWPVGPAELGYGDAIPEATEVGYGPDAANKYVTTYFRHAFRADDAITLGESQLRLLVDDGALVYLNGEKIVHFNLPPDPVTYSTFALNNANENAWQSFVVPGSFFVSGTNHLASEVHQVQPSSSDLSFALELIGKQRVVEPWISRQPRSKIVEEGRDLALEVETAPGGTSNVQWYRVGEGELDGAVDNVLILPEVKRGQGGGYYAVVANALGTVTSEVATVTVVLPDLTDRVVINEIMYHPSSERPEEEYIELLNLHENTVNLAGWRFSKGIQFVFPEVEVQPGGMIVVAADESAFRSKYPSVTNVVGGWTGRLRDSGERITLKDSLDRTIDTVRFADTGDWAVRRRGVLDFGTRGWEWSSAHDGMGSSLELRNPELFNDSGQNWQASVESQGSPGRRNGAETSDIPPMILDVTHSPSLPKSTNDVVVAARLLDETFLNFSVNLHYRDHSTTSPPPFTVVEMTDDGLGADANAGDGVYAAMVPAHAQGTVIEFYVEAVDLSGGTRAWPAPALNETGVAGQWANALYQVDDDDYSGDQPMLRTIMTETDRLIFRDINRSSDAQMNATFISTDGAGSEVRHNTGVRVRGASSRFMPVHSIRVNIPSDRDWKGLTAINVNAFFSHDQVIGGMLSAKAGLAAADARAVQLRMNGINMAKAGIPDFTDGTGFGSFALVEVVNGDWADRLFPNDSGGNIYFARRPNTDLSYLGTNVSAYLSAGYSKSSNENENDWSDLIHLTDVLNNAPDETYVQDVLEVLDPEAWMRYFALNTVIGNNESSLANGDGDDYDMYRGVSDPRFLLVAHDWDTILGQAGSLPSNAGLFLATALPSIDRFLKHPEFVPLYYAELTRLIDTVCSPEELHPFLDQVLGDYVDAGTLAAMKAYVTARADYIRSQIPMTLTAVSDLPMVHGKFQSTSPLAALHGSANVIDTRTVLVNGVPSEWSAWEGRWTNAAVVLQPGLNYVTIQALDGNGNVSEEGHLDIWYDDGNQITIGSGSLTGDNNWDAASGPYYLSGQVEVPEGSTLTIQPGTTMYGAPGAFLRIRGRLIAEGTETQRIRLAGAPGGSPWKGVGFFGSKTNNLLSHVVFDNSGVYPVEVRDSRLHLEGVVFRSQFGSIYTTNSALHIKNCVFPTMFGYESIFGLYMPDDGYFILEGNTFGGTSGYSDIIDFTGGKRPGPILQAYNNVFLEGTDDGFDLDGTDAHIEGNLFMHFHRDAPRESISCGIATDISADIVAARNVFYDCDNAVLLKRNAFLTAVNNTFVACVETVVDFGSTNRVIRPGLGANFVGNISWDNASTFERYFEPGYSDVDLEVRQSIIQGTNWPGIGNLSLDPLFFNASNDFRLRPGSPAIGTGPNGLDMGAYVPSGASISGEPPSVTPLNDAQLTIAGPGITHYRFRVNDGEFSSPERSIDEPLILTNLSDGTYVVEVIGKNSAGRWQNEDEPTVSRTWTVDALSPRIVLSEVLARNVQAHNHFGTYPDLIELHNAGAGPYDLSGLRLTDDALQPDKFVFPPGTVLAQGEYLILLANAPDITPGWHLGFSLQDTGEGVFLFDSLARGGALLDSVSFGMQLPDFSLGRMPNGEWHLAYPTFGGANIAASVGDPSSLRLSEWLAKGAGDDFIELYNPLPVPVALGGIYLTDNPIGWPNRHQVAPLSFAAADSYFIFKADAKVGAGADHVNFSLALEQGIIALFDKELSLLDVVAYGPQLPGQSSGRLAPDGEKIVRFELPSPGAENWRNDPPTIRLVEPVDGQSISLPGDVTLLAEALDSDGVVVKVAFYADQTLIGEVEASPFSLVWSNAPPGAHTLIAIATDNLGAVVISDLVTINPGQSSVVVTSPEPGFVTPVGGTVPIAAVAAFDPSLLARVEFYANENNVGLDTEYPYEFDWISETAGDYELRAVAVTLTGSYVESNPVDVHILATTPLPSVSLITTNGVWKYWDNGGDLGEAWRPAEYDDGSWKEGLPQFGYGEGDETTVVDYGTDAAAKHVTTYFRHHFDAGDAAQWRGLSLRLLVDDGAVLYLNGHELMRLNMPTGPVSYQTYAFNATEAWMTFDVPADAMVSGSNVLSVEVHQVQPASSDLSFALEMVGNRHTVEPWILQQPRDLTADAGMAASFEVIAAGYPLTYQWFRATDMSVVGGDDATLTFDIVEPTDEADYFVVVSNALGSMTSRNARLTVEITDHDGDGIPDYWEIQNGLNPGDAGDAGLDFDDDGVSNLGEFMKGTDPNIANFFVTIETSSETTRPTEARLRFLAEAGVAYTVEVNDSLDGTSWRVLTEVAPVSELTVQEIIVSISPGSQFFRVRR